MSETAEYRIQVPEAAAQLGISQRQVRRLCEDGSLDASQIGTRWTISPSSVRKVLAEGRNRRAAKCPLPATKTSTNATEFGGLGLRLTGTKSGGLYEQHLKLRRDAG